MFGTAGTNVRDYSRRTLTPFGLSTFSLVRRLLSRKVFSATAPAAAFDRAGLGATARSACFSRRGHGKDHARQS
ncbi:MAG TPA: hypothetical protein PKH07_16470, partial [bacterium]|nr:hypothetical protein [bacterium]